jgi:hypothetical protein
MSANWELALSYATGEYVTVLGDDDGLLSYALAELDGLLASHSVQALRWDAGLYLWPTISVAEEAHFISIPTGRYVRLVDARTAIASVSRFEECYTSLPMVYNSVVHRDLLEQLRQRSGRVFANTLPDIYSGFAVAYMAGSFLSVGVPMSVAGLSRQSNGVATLRLRGHHPVARDFQTLNTEQGFVSHSWVPDLPLFPVAPVADSFLFAKQTLFPEDNDLRLDRKAFIHSCVRTLTAETDHEWHEAFKAIRHTLRDDPRMQAWFDAAFSRQQPVLGPALRLRQPNMGVQGTHVHLNADQFGVADIVGATRLCENILGYGTGAIVYKPTAESQPVLDTQALVEQTQVLQRAADERLALVNQSHHIAEERLALVNQLHHIAEERLAFITTLKAELEGIRPLARFIQRVRRFVLGQAGSLGGDSNASGACPTRENSAA